MKLLLILCILSFAGVSMAFRPGFLECEQGSHIYSTGCDYLQPEPTCDDPNPPIDKTGKICDYSTCHCDFPTVRNKDTEECVPLDKCPQ